VGKIPYGAAVNPMTNKVYVTNIQSSTVSVIDGITHKITSTISVNPSLAGSYKIRDPVLSMHITAKFPLIASLVAVDDITNMLYVTNTGSNTVSITDSVVVKVGFNVNLFLAKKSKAITDSIRVKEIVNKFISKYGESEVNKYYTKFDVCVEFVL
jgi:YVTN family beta-propeller protein